MTWSRSARGGTRWVPRVLVAVLLVVVAATLARPSPATRSPVPAPSTAASSPAGPSPTVPPVQDRAAVGEADGVLPDGTTVHDDDLPGVANLDPALLDALRRATAGAADAGVGLSVTSGWRSPAYQDQLFREAVAEHGSAAEAARWVATADTSVHVSGDAVDVGPAGAMAWLAEHGAGYGLCPVYANEPWHFELRPEAVGDGCPRAYPDPTHDPRLRR